jgi:hypothetical protein
MERHDGINEKELRESLLASTNSETAEQLTAIRARIVDHVRKAGDIDAVRAALPTLLKGFTFDGLIETDARRGDHRLPLPAR